MNQKYKEPIHTEYCNDCHWSGPQNKTIVEWDSEHNVTIKCPLCKSDITYNMPGQEVKKKIDFNFFLYLLLGFSLIIMYLVVQTFLSFAWLVSLGRAGSPLEFHRDVMYQIRKMPKMY